MVFHQPLELKYWLVNTLSGSAEIFIFVSMIAIASLAAYFRMPNSIALMMIVIFAFMTSSVSGGWLIVPILILVGYFVFWSWSRIQKT